MQRHRWSDELLTGEPLVDLQHKTLFEMVEALRVAIESGLEQAIFADSLFATLLYATEHFRDEEALMARVEYPGLAAQQRMHAAFASDAGEMAKAYAERQSVSAEVLHDFLSDWLDNHVRTQDALLARFLDAEYREG
jgi:hemerythrin